MLLHSITIYCLIEEHVVVSHVLSRVVHTWHLVDLIHLHGILHHVVFVVKELSKVHEVLLDIGIERSVRLKLRIERLRIIGENARQLRRSDILSLRVKNILIEWILSLITLIWLNRLISYILHKRTCLSWWFLLVLIENAITVTLAHPDCRSLVVGLIENSILR